MMQSSLGVPLSDIDAQTVGDELVYPELRLPPESIAAVSTDGNGAADASQLRRV